MKLESILEIFKSSYMILYVIVLLLALWKYKIYSKTYLKYFPVILFFNLVGDYLGEYLYNNYSLNAWLYNLQSLVVFIFIFIVFRLLIKKQKFKNYITFFAILFSFIVIYFAIVGDFIAGNQYQTFIAGAILSILCILFYYIEILQSNEVIDIKYSTIFWISIGYLLYFAGSIPIEIIRFEYATEENTFEILQLIYYTLIIILNTCFIVGFLVMKPKPLQS